MSTVAVRRDALLEVGDFLAFLEGRRGERWELHEGVPQAMVGGTYAHAMIGGNIVAALKDAARGRGCNALGGFLVAAANKSAYEPDALVLCEPVENHSRSTDRPTIVFEVLSPSTMRFDREGKARNYRAIPSLQQLVFVYQDSVRVESWLKHDGHWTLGPKVLLDREESLALPAIGGSLPVEAIYAGIVPSPFDD